MATRTKATRIRAACVAAALGAGFGALLSGAAAAATITNPDWVRKPTGEEISNHYPRLMAALGVEGHAWIHCDVTIQGEPANCTVKAESPAGLGFGKAALDMTASFRFSPRRVDGKPDAGGSVNIPLTFSLDTDSDGGAPPLPDLAGIDPKTAALARRMAAMMASGEQLGGLEHWIREQADKIPVDGDPAARARFIEVYLTAAHEVTARIIETRTALIAQLFTPDQLAQTVAFLESPAGQAFRTNSEVLGGQIAAFIQRRRPLLAAAALKAYCAQPGACPPRPASEP